MQRAIVARALILIGVLVLSHSPAAGQTAARDSRAAACAASLEALELPGVAVTKVEWFPEDSPAPPPGPFAPPLDVRLPAYCRVDGLVDARTGADGRSYGIGFALALPVQWNGRFLMQGGSGFNGFVAPPIGAEAAGEALALARGFAIVSTDTGHRSDNPFDTTFMREQQASLDFAYQAIGRVASLAKALITAHYARPVAYSYFTGCSTGGREAMLMAQRHPTEFDGVISGAPAMRANVAAIGAEWVAVMLNQVAPRTADGQPLTGEAFSDADRRLIIDALLEACDGGDGLSDGMIFNMRGCAFDPKALVCTGDKAEDCLSQAQVSALERVFDGPRDSRGRPVYVPFPFDTGIATAGALPGLLRGGIVRSGTLQLDVDAAANAAAADPVALLTNTAGWTNLNTFSSRGGKLLFYHGLSDPTFSAHDTIGYHERLAAANGGVDEVGKWSRLFLVPGMGHCRGGEATLDGFDLLTAVVDWVERGIGPEHVTATGSAVPGRSRPLCAYPLYARYSGMGDPDEAASFECTAHAP